MSAVQKLSRFQVRFLQHARRRRRLGSLACPRVPVPSSYRSLSGALGNQAPASGAKTWNESRWVCQRIDIQCTCNYDGNMVRVAVPQWSKCSNGSWWPDLTPGVNPSLVCWLSNDCTLVGSIPSHTHTHTHTSLLLSPAVRFLLGTNNIDPSLLTPTGPNNRLLKRYSTVNLSRT